MILHQQFHIYSFDLEYVSSEIPNVIPTTIDGFGATDWLIQNNNIEIGQHRTINGTQLTTHNSPSSNSFLCLCVLLLFFFTNSSKKLYMNKNEINFIALRLVVNIIFLFIFSIIILCVLCQCRWAMGESIWFFLWVFFLGPTN